MARLWPLAYWKTIACPAEDAAGFWSRLRVTLAEELSRARARHIRTSGNAIEFMGGLLRPVSSLNLLVAINYGRIERRDREGGISLYWELHFGEVFLVSIAGGLALASVGPRSAPGQFRTGIGAFLFFFLCFFLGNRTLSIWRFNGLIRRALRKASSAAPTELA